MGPFETGLLLPSPGPSSHPPKLFGWWGGFAKGDQNNHFQ